MVSVVWFFLMRSLIKAFKYWPKIKSNNYQCLSLHFFFSMGIWLTKPCNVSQHCVCWWPDICRHSDDQDLVPHAHGTSMWRGHNLATVSFNLIHREYASVNWVSIGSGNGLSPVRRQAITWTNAGLLSFGPLGTNFSEMRIKIQDFSFTKAHLKMSSAKWRPFCQGDNMLIYVLQWDVE